MLYNVKIKIYRCMYLKFRDEKNNKFTESNLQQGLRKNLFRKCKKKWISNKDLYSK